jgi:hypothetical protein
VGALKGVRVSRAAGKHTLNAFDFRCSKCNAWNKQLHEFFLGSANAWPLTPSNNEHVTTYIALSVLEGFHELRVRGKAVSVPCYLGVLEASGRVHGNTVCAPPPPHRRFGRRVVVRSA